MKIIQYFPKWIKPNHLTIIRLILLAPLVWLLLEEHYIWFVVLFLIAWVTDLLDGALARQRKQITAWGVFLDPLADKLLFYVPLILIAYGLINEFLFWIMIISETILFILSWTFVGILRAMKMKFEFTSNYFGKSKAVVQLIIIVVLIISLFIENSLVIKSAEILISVALVLMSLSLVRALSKVR